MTQPRRRGLLSRLVGKVKDFFTIPEYQPPREETRRERERREWTTGFDYGGPRPAPDTQYEITYGRNQDPHVKEMFERIHYSHMRPRSRTRLANELIRYTLENYGVDIFAAWEWEDFRAWYDAQAA